MAWFGKRNGDDVAWYRHRNYKGSLSEDQKMELDSIRWNSKIGRHPAAKFEDLPEEVQDYIVYLEIELSDSKSFPSTITIIVGIALAIYCALSAIDFVQYSDVFPSIIKLSLFSIALIGIGILDARKIRKRLVEKDTDAEFMENWEINYISKRSIF